MGLLDGVLGGLVASGINEVIRQNGGVHGLVSRFEQQGLGGIAQSWVGTGANQPVSSAQLEQVLGADAVARIAGKLGVSRQDLLSKLTELLPQAVDTMTPDGVMPKA